MRQMEGIDFVRENLEDIYNWIARFVTQYSNLLADLKNSNYYQRKGLQERMLFILMDQKEFLKVYLECINVNRFFRLRKKYGNPEDILEIEE